MIFESCTFIDTHITARNEFVDKYIDILDDFWDVIFTDEKPLQNFANAKTKIWRTTEEANDPLLHVIKDKTGRFSINLWGYVSSIGWESQLGIIFFFNFFWK